MPAACRRRRRRRIEPWWAPRRPVEGSAGPLGRHRAQSEVRPAAGPDSAGKSASRRCRKSAAGAVRLRRSVSTPPPRADKWRRPSAVPASISPFSSATPWSRGESRWAVRCCRRGHSRPAEWPGRDFPVVAAHSEHRLRACGAFQHGARRPYGCWHCPASCHLSGQAWARTRRHLLAAGLAQLRVMPTTAVGQRCDKRRRAAERSAAPTSPQAGAAGGAELFRSSAPAAARPARAAAPLRMASGRKRARAACDLQRSSCRTDGPAVIVDPPHSGVPGAGCCTQHPPQTAPIASS